MAGLTSVSTIDFAALDEQSGFSAGDFIVFVRTVNGVSSWCKVSQSKITSLAIVQAWAANTEYNQNTLISNDSVLYQVTKDFTSGTTFDDTNLQQITPNLNYTESGGLILSAPEISNPIVSGMLTTNVVSLSSASCTIDPTTGSVFFVSLNNPITTISMAPLSASTKEQCVACCVVIRQNTEGGTLTWGNDITWANGASAPTMPTATGSYLVVDLYTFDQGQTWIATVGPKGDKGDAGTTTVVNGPTTPTETTTTDNVPSMAYLYFMGQN